MPDYQLGKIYKIVDNTNGNVYFGSTCEPTLARRLAKHVGNYKSWKDGKRRFTTSFKIIENQNYDIVLLESCPCGSKDELHKRERYYIESLECVNKVIVGRTPKEYGKDYREKNKEKLKETHKNCYKENPEKFKEIYKKYYKKYLENVKARKSKVCNCKCGKIYTHGNKSQHIKSKFHQNFINSQEQN
jgi:hypothetical protein